MGVMFYLVDEQEKVVFNLEKSYWFLNVEMGTTPDADDIELLRIERGRGHEIADEIERFLKAHPKAVLQTEHRWHDSLEPWWTFDENNRLVEADGWQQFGASDWATMGG